MADFGFGDDFDPASVPERENNFEPVPGGVYRVEIVSSDVVDAKSGNGRILVLEMDIKEGQFAGRKLWDRINIQHTSQEAQAIGQRQLADLFLATGAPPSRNSDDLHFKPCLARVGIDPAKGEYPAKNVIKQYKPLGQAAPAAKAAPVAVATSPKAAAPAAAASGRPWARKSA